MPFLRGSLGFQRFSVSGFDDNTFGDEQIELLANNAAGRFETASVDNVSVGFLGGDHLFDTHFDLGKNLINNAVHCSVRIDTNQIPASIKAAWLQMELAGLAKDSETGVVTKAQRKEAKEAVEARCDQEAATGKYRKMQTFSLLWDLDQETLYFGGSVGNAARLCIELLERTFGIELRHQGAGAIATQWAINNKVYGDVDDLQPISFVSDLISGDHSWSNEHSQAPDFLGNEFLVWLWWKLETDTDTFALVDETEVTVMLAKTLSLECPFGESGKETISAECPIKLPEATKAIQCGKLPRKAGMTVIREGRQFDLTLQAESFGISGAKIHLEDDEEFDDDDRIDAIRLLTDTTDLMLQTYVERRISDEWLQDHQAIRKWLTGSSKQRSKAA
ncbi:hypothetical protein [Rhodopirellula sp. MGV]|uniref:hypothetical protein n=1 Tax=Rhodopirellula sp. MGV TaxID=2023130 RepID=UPI000B95E4FA|nr:hypothetical protein [Rhodopirellula sp. MGV]OYP38245.1 hypothetical protein CGZ80_03235 [Rhodopirellula sp. MGV]PNY38582.1 hypothetical protein C2E31_01290 [Rhodopirellula baltica]